MGDENSAASDGRDLFGNPIEPIRDRRGRPSFAKSKENQDFVSVRAAAGWSQSMIAAAIGCDEKTLRKYFSRELQHGQLLIEGEILDVQLHKMRQGHAPSARALQERLDRVAIPPKPARPAEGDAAGDDDKPAALGKKAQRLADAAEPVAGYDDLYARMRQAQKRPQ